VDFPLENTLMPVIRTALILGVGATFLLGPPPLSAQTAAEDTPPDQLLLKDYRPRSIFNVPQTRVEKARFPVIDVHSHPYAKTPAQVEQWVRNMDDVGIAKVIILASAPGKAFDDAVALFQAYPERFEVWCGIDYTGFDQPGFAQHALAELARCHRAGAAGVGELVDKGRGLMGHAGNPSALGMHIDDPRMDPILETCAALQLPVNIHVGEDRWMYEPMDRTNDGLMNAFKWKVTPGPDVLDHDPVIATLERAVAKHPRTTFIACHLANCCSDLSILGKMLDAHPNLSADLGARFRETAPIPRFMARFFARYQDRLLYGTDMGFDAEMYRTTFRILETEDEHFYADALRGYHWPLHGFGLKDEVLRKVYAENARRILNRAKSR
jgi:predicted TIM-barrel fold metal-dependent hydrolase